MKFFAWIFCLSAFALSAEPRHFIADSIQINVGNFSSPSAVWRLPNPENPQVFVWFHGGMQSAKCAKGYEAGAALVPFLENLSKNVAVASVSACRENHWLSPAPLKAVDGMLDSLEVRWNLKIDTVSLVGVSDGGLGVVGYTLYGRRCARSRLLVSTNLGAVSDAENLSGDPKIRRGTWTFLQGGADRLYPSSGTLPWMERFCSSLGRKSCKIRFDENGEHDWSWWALHRKSWILDFLR